MASIIRLKRSATTGSPTALAQGEVAYSYLSGTQSNGGDRLYIGTGTEVGGEAANIEVIGGKYFTEKLDHVPGILTANSALIVDSNSKLDVINVDNITINGNAITTTDTNGNIQLSPNGSGSVDVATSKIINLVDPTSNQDAATKAYVDTQVGAVVSDFTIAGDTGTDTFETGQTLNFAGGNNITSAVSNNQVSFSLNSTVSGLSSITVGNISLAGNVLSSTDANGDITLTPNGSGSVIISSDLIVEGNTITINSNEVNIGDSIILLNADEAGVPSQNGGIEINRGTSVNKSLVWNETLDKWTVGSETFVAGIFEGNLTGNSNTATSLSTARNFSITGDVVATAVSFDGTGNVSLNATINTVDGGEY